MIGPVDLAGPIKKGTTMNRVEAAATRECDALKPLDIHSEGDTPVLCPVAVAAVGAGLLAGGGFGYYAAQDDGYVREEPDTVGMTDDVREMSVADLLMARQQG